MNKIYYFLICLLPFIGQSQSLYNSASNDNYIGYVGSYNQPASLVNSVNKFSVTTSFQSYTSSNFRGLNSNALSVGIGNEQKRYRDHNGGGYEARNNSIDVLGLQYEINHNNAVGYSFRIRLFSNVSGLPNDFTFADHNNFDSTKPVNTLIPFSDYNLSQFIYNEHRFNYARVIFNTGERMLKAGIGVKIINGLDATFLRAETGNLMFTQQNGDQIDFSNTNFEYGRAEKKNQFSSRQPGFGLDLGAVYEFRPNHKDYFYDMDGQKNIEKYNTPKYKWKAGASLTDIGRVKFSKDPNSFNFNSNDSIDGIDFYQFGVSGINLNNFSLLKNFDSLASAGTAANDQDDKFRMNLPTALNLQFDYNLIRNIYVSYTSTTPLKSKNDPSKVYYKAIHSIAARIETEKYCIQLPISLQANGTVNVGLSGRLKVPGSPIQLFAGAQNINNWLGVRGRYTRNFYGGLIISRVYEVLTDIDGDKISDFKDECVFDPGVEKFKGCPDSDGDGIPDKEDYCIYTPGIKSKNGCPDTDGDGIIDLDDQCPEEKGLAIHYGCPDRDKDGVIDVADRCPDEPGIELNNGCPFENRACCSDDDGDGVPNDYDKCPKVSGSVYNFGCPIDSTNLEKIKLKEEKKDKDPNNTIDKVDEIKDAKPKVPTQEGTVITKPIDRTDEVETLNIYFDVDDATVDVEYDLKIRELAQRYNFKDGKYKLVMIGHTDNDGTDNYNLILSKKRAETVRRKFEGNKVDYDLITVYYYGENRPVKSNDNKENKQFNRRVEVIVMKVK
jgi:outer membrane protein OmpA-like peptidoglycan-associated protein